MKPAQPFASPPPLHVVHGPPGALPAAEVAPHPRIALVVDDVGYDLSLMDAYARLGIPLTMAILPGDRRSKALAKKAHQLGFGVMLHLPLEPIDLLHNSPGVAGLYLAMTPAERHRQFLKNVDRVPFLTGINNHMGSAFTENEPAMTDLLNWIHEKDLFFLDSRTSQRSVAAFVARRLGLPILTNRTFLDNVDEPEAIEAQLEKAIRLARRRGSTVAIGHYRRKHLRATLERLIPQYKTYGIVFVRAQDLLKK